MTDWFARPVLQVRDVETSLCFYADRLGFAGPWATKRMAKHVAQIERQDCALILADTWPEKIGKVLVFISLNADPAEQNGGRAARRTRGQGRSGQGRFMGISASGGRRSR